MDTAGIKPTADMFDWTEEYDEEDVFDMCPVTLKIGLHWGTYFKKMMNNENS